LEGEALNPGGKEVWGWRLQHLAICWGSGGGESKQVSAELLPKNFETFSLLYVST